ncbi:MAG: virulence protein RhuM/Fic/DOC family protein [Gammaproteobacteria bacterium]|nr:virulence protein RhuM/Fic/DOC family protein [Gammaproteobacteria bacterium]
MRDVIVFESGDKGVDFRVMLDGDTVWLSQAQMVELFGRDQSVIARHIRNAIDDGEVLVESNMQKMHIANSDKPVVFYDLDVIISVGYRIKSPRGVEFRKWATRVLKDHLIKGYSLNKQRLTSNMDELDAALALIRKTSQSPELTVDSGRGLVDVVTRYAQTFLLLQRYDEGLLTDPPCQTGGVLPTHEQAMTSLQSLKASLIERGEATQLFAQERGDAFAALLGNLDQTVFGEPAYPTVELKAAHLLYFVIKNHPFSDGNKRSGAFLFIDFLNQNGRLLDKHGNPIINDIGMAALALLVAESAPESKETMIKLIMNMISER